MKKIQLVKFAINQLVKHHLRKVYFFTGLKLFKPSQVTIVSTVSCNLKCKYCNVWKYRKVKELSTEEWKKIIADLKGWLGPFFLSFSGGEPLLRRDITELIEFASKLGIMTNLGTNGIPLNKKMIDKLANAGLDFLYISLDGINPKTHDSLRGRGVFKKVISNIEHCIKNNRRLKIGIGTTLTSKNLDEIVDLIKWEKNKGLNGVFQALVDPYFLFSGKYESGWYRKSKIWPGDTNKVERAIDNIILMKKNGYSINNSIKQLELMKEYFKDPNKTFQNLNCTAGESSFFISPNGGMLLCPFIKSVIGNLKKQSAKEIWLSKKAADLRKQIRKCKRGCILMNCNFDASLKSKIYRFMDYVR